MSFRSSLPRRRSIGCIGSLITSLCGMVCFATCLKGWVNSFWLSFGSVTVSVVVVRIVNVAIRVRGIGITIFVSRVIWDFFQFVLAVFSTTGTDFYNVLVFYGSDTLVWFCQHLHLHFCGSHYLFVFVCSSSGASKPFCSNSLSRCVIICSCVPFSKWA